MHTAKNQERKWSAEQAEIARQKKAEERKLILEKEKAVSHGLIDE